METLYIIGNGFDLHHSLPTSYADFNRFVLSNNIELSDTIEEYFTMNLSDHFLWSNFEEDLGSFDWELFHSNHNNIDTNNDNFRPSDTYGLEDELVAEAEEIKQVICSTFEEWIESIDISQARRKLRVLKNSRFISFNYTLLLEEIYNIPQGRVFHIHGDISGNSEELVFGHNKTMDEVPELDEKGDSNRTLFTDSESAAKAPFHSFYKPVGEIINSNTDTFESMKDFKDIYVLGHSLNYIDVPYFKEIHNRSKKSKWHVSFYEDKEKETHLSTLLQIGIPSESINLYKL